MVKKGVQPKAYTKKFDGDQRPHRVILDTSNPMFPFGKPLEPSNSTPPLQTFATRSFDAIGKCHENSRVYKNSNTGSPHKDLA